MAVQYASIGTADGVTNDSDTTLVLGVPSGMVAGDLLVAVGVANSRYMAASGWTRLTSTTAILCVLYKIATGDEGASVTFTTNMTYSYMSAVMLRFTGARAPYLLALNYYPTWDAYIPFSEFTIEESGAAALYLGSVPVDNYTGTVYTPPRGTIRYNSNFNSVSSDPIVATEDNLAVGRYPAMQWTLSAAQSEKRSQVLIIPPAITEKRGHAQATRIANKAQDYVRSVWAQSGRALNSGTFGTPATYVEEVCKAAWENSSRALINQFADKYPTPVIESYSVGTITDTGSNLVTIASPAGTQPGDLLLAVFTMAGGVWVLPPRDKKWVDLTKPVPSAVSTNMMVMARVADSETASYSFETNALLTTLHGVILRVAGAGITQCTSSAISRAKNSAPVFNVPVPSELGSLILWCVGTAAATASSALIEVYDADPGGADARAIAIFSEVYNGTALVSPTITLSASVAYHSIGISLSAPKRVTQ
jgi:hypothetical protein